MIATNTYLILVTLCITGYMVVDRLDRVIELLEQDELEEEEQ